MLAFRHVQIRNSNSLKSSRSLLIAGAGDLGTRLAKLRVTRGEEVIALRRREVSIAGGVRSLRVDLVTGEGFSGLPRRPDALVFCAAPDKRTEADYRALYVDGLRRLLDALEMPRLIFVSSTAVYAEDAGEWVDETTPPRMDAPVSREAGCRERPPRAEQFNGRVLLEAERELAVHSGALVLRLSGIYGPGREMMVRRAREGSANRPRWSNRIHIDDAAAALSHLLDIAAPERVYLGSDDRPALESEVQTWLRAREGLPPAAQDTSPETGRRVSNARLRASGWNPAYPDYRAGYSELLSQASV